jgi:hypothetical protein
MKKTTKVVLALTLALLLAVGCYFGVAASDEDDTGGGCAVVTMKA